MILEGNLKGVQHLGIPAVDLKATKKWYVDILGFEIIYETTISDNGEKIDVAFLKLGNLVIETYQLSGSQYEEIKTRCHGHIDHFAIDVDDIDTALGEAISRGALLDDSTKDGLVTLESFWSKGAKYVNLAGPNKEKVELNQNLAAYKADNGTFKGWAHLGLPVCDIEKSVRFYNNLGFNEVMRTTINGDGGTIKVAFVELGDFQVEMYQLFGSELEALKSRGNGHVDHIALDVADIDSAFNEVSKAGLNSLDKAPNYLPFWDNGVKFFTITGPDGEKIEFNQKL